MEKITDRQKILIVDDSEMNRAILADMLGGEFDIVEAENGVEGVAMLQKHGLEISLVLLDIVMPVMDGFGVLTQMNKYRWIEDIPVIMISAERGSSHVERAFELGITDFISRPFDAIIVHRRVVNTILLYAKQKRLTAMVAEQIYEKEQRSSLMIDILSHCVEFRNGESGMHVRNVHILTETLLNALLRKTDRYHISQADISVISTASALHDIGKIAIPEEILNKPGKFTPEEFAIMKTHSMVGAEMLENLPSYQNEPLVSFAYQICRWHHERYDGRGYPDGLKGEQIPIAAQVVALADVYDALTSKRVYKPAFTPEKAVEMILNGECGCFNPLLLECLKDVQEDLKEELVVLSLGNAADKEIQKTVAHALKTDGADVSNRTIRLFEHERMKNKILSDLSKDIIFEYSLDPEMIELSDWGAEYLGLPATISEPRKSDFGKRVFRSEDFAKLLDDLKNTTPDNPAIVRRFVLDIKGEKTSCKIFANSMWADTEPPEYEGAIGKIVDVNDETEELNRMEQKANLDFRTGLYNHEAAKERINLLLGKGGNKKYALVMLDLDNFKQANDVYGHLFGDEILQFVADVIKKNVRSSDVAARMGGDEFIIFMEYKDSVLPQIERIFKHLHVSYKNFPVGLSMGVACTDGNIGYDTLFAMADKAMYVAKKEGKNGFRFYDEETEQKSKDKKERD